MLLSPDSAQTVKSAISCSSTFEMKLVDFPELGDITPGDPALTSGPLEPSACVSVMSEERQSLPAATCKVTFTHAGMILRTLFRHKLFTSISFYGSLANFFSCISECSKSKNKAGTTSPIEQTE